MLLRSISKSEREVFFEKVLSLELERGWQKRRPEGMKAGRRPKLGKACRGRGWNISQDKMVSAVTNNIMDLPFKLTTLNLL